MDTFDERLKNLQELSQEEQQNKFSEMRSKCTCPNCPTFNNCAEAKDERLFCFSKEGESCITDEKDCICPDCPITDQMGLENTFFCTRGPEEDQRT